MIVLVAKQNQENVMGGDATTLNTSLKTSMQRFLFHKGRSELKFPLKPVTNSGAFLLKVECDVSCHVRTTETEFAFNPLPTKFMIALFINTVTPHINRSPCLPISFYALTHYPPTIFHDFC